MEKEYDSAKDMFKAFDEEFKREHPISYWVDNSIFHGKGLFGYAPHYSLTHPLVILSDIADELKFAWQRVFRGWDDRVIWSIDSWLDGIMPDILMKYKADNRGLPHFAFDGMEADKDGNYSDEQYSQAVIVWENEIDKMIFGFMASKEKNEIGFTSIEQYDAEMATLEAIRLEGMNSFVKHYGALWD